MSELCKNPTMHKPECECKVSQSKNHTPGPYHVVKETFYYFTIRSGTPGVLAGSQEIAQLHTMLPNNEANAQLIAAAPELLEALKFIEERLNHMGVNPIYDPVMRSDIKALKETTTQAIAKAEGRVSDNGRA